MYTILNKQPLSNGYYSPNEKEAKQNTPVSFWARPTIKWDISCESTTSRQSAYNTITEGSESETNTDNTHTRVLLYTSGIGIAGCACFSGIIAFWFI